MCRLTMLQFRHISVVWIYLLLPSLLCANLRCYYSPILEKEKKYELIETECPPGELCFKADGRFGNYSALTARGCMAKETCSRVTKIRYKGVVYSMSYACCEGPYCNSCLGVTASLCSVALTLVTAAVMANSL